MFKFTEQDFTSKMNLLSSELQKKFLLLQYDDWFLGIINYKSVKSREVITEIGFATKVTALGFASKQEMFKIIKEAVNDEEEARHIFADIDKEILAPNGLQGAPEEVVATVEEENNEDEEIALEKNEASINQKVETAEDILREIENPTSSPLILPAIKASGVKTPEIKIPEAPDKAGEMDSKLTEASVQPAKSTYYKLDPYREQIQ